MESPYKTGFMEGKMKSSKKRLMMVIGIFLLTAPLLVAPSRSADLKIGVVDVQRALNECNEGKENKKALAKEVEDLQRLVAAKQNELQAMKDSLDKQARC